MATVDVTSGGTEGHPSRRQKHVPYVVTKQITAAAAVAAKGSALATADVIQAIDVPADTMVLAASFEVTTADSGTAAPITAQLDSIAFTGAYGATTAGVAVPVEQVAHVIAANTIDLVLGTLSAAGDDWVLNLSAVLVDVSPYPTVQSAKGT